MKIIAHLDMDAFFAAIEERGNPQFAGFPIVIGADPKAGAGRGVVSTSNYEARKFGIQSAMPISTAWRLAQDGRKKGGRKTVFLPVNHHHYSEVSKKVMDIIHQKIPLLEQTSVDEAYLDLSEFKSYEQATSIISDVKNIILAKENLTATVAIAGNKLVAKIASAKYKPNGLVIIYPDLVERFLDPLSIREIPGIGPKTEESLNKKKIFKIKDLRNIAKEQLIAWFGKWGEDLYWKARGVGDDSLSPEHEVKSISEQETFDEDSSSAAFLIDTLQEIAKRVGLRVIREGVNGFKTITITVRFSDFTTRSRSHSLKEYTLSIPVIQHESLKLFLPFLDRRENPGKKLIRLLGVGVENFQGDEKIATKPSKPRQISFIDSLIQ